MRIGQVAARLDVSPDFIRDLERRGAVPPLPRDLNGHRRLTEDDVARLRALIYGPSRAGDTASVDDIRRWAEGNGIPWPDPD